MIFANRNAWFYYRKAKSEVHNLHVTLNLISTMNLNLKSFVFDPSIIGYDIYIGLWVPLIDFGM